MSFNTNHTKRDVMTSYNGELSNQVDNFKYIGSYVSSTEHDIYVRI